MAKKETIHFVGHEGETACGKNIAHILSKRGRGLYAGDRRVRKARAKPLPCTRDVDEVTCDQCKRSWPFTRVMDARIRMAENTERHDLLLSRRRKFRLVAVVDITAANLDDAVVQANATFGRRIKGRFDMDDRKDFDVEIFDGDPFVTVTGVGEALNRIPNRKVLIRN